MTRKNNPLHTFVILAYKKSMFLEECVKSVLAQEYQSEVTIATTTDNDFIRKIAKKYNLNIVIGEHTNIGGDFDFAVSCAKTPLVTVAHQDDVYEHDYSKQIITAFEKYPNSSIIFSDYYEIRREEKVYTNTNLKIKRMLLFPIRIKKAAKSRWLKRSALRFGDAICCPAVSFVRKNCPKDIFASDFKCDVDWHAWEKLSNDKYSFVFVPQKLMGHRISEESTTTDIINQGIRTKEDFEILQRFWPKPIAKILTKKYQKSEKSNKIKD